MKEPSTLHYLWHPKLRFIYFVGALFIVIGVVFFMALESWNFIDAFYFTVSTMTTVGFGDTYPTHPASRLVATFYMLLSVPFLLVSIGVVVEVLHDRLLNTKTLGDYQKKK